MRPVRALAAASAVMLAGLGVLPGATSAEARTPQAVRVQVTDMSPWIPRPTDNAKPLTVTLTLTNTTGREIDGVTVTGERAMPIANQEVLDNELSDPTPPTDGLPVPSTQPVTVDLPPDTPTTVTFRTTTGLNSPQKPASLCVCTKWAVYPLWFDVNAPDSTLLGQAETFVPAFYRHPAPVQVGWVWPLIDEPHRLLPNRPFVDDKLAYSVNSGRLSRSLSVVEQVAGKVPLTLVIDPELLDELEVMATTPYKVHGPNGIVDGTGHVAAASWLHRLQDVLSTDQNVRVALTPYGDPDIDSLTRADLPWSSTLPPPMQQRVSAALGGHPPDAEFAFPPSGTVSPKTLGTLARSGVTSVLLGSHAVGRQTDATGLPLSLATLDGASTSGGGTMSAGLVDPAIEHLAASSMSQKGSAAGTALPQLLADIAVRAAAAPSVSHAVFIAAPRRFDPVTTNAVRTILQTSDSSFSQPANVLDVLAAAAQPPGTTPAGAPTALPTKLAPDHARAMRLGRVVVRKARWLNTTLPSLRQMFTPQGPAAQAGGQSGPTAGAKILLDNISEAAQLSESSAWLPLSSLGGRAAGADFARSLADSVRHVLTGVHIVNPKNASYTLASDNSPLPITVENDLPFPVYLRIHIWTVNGQPGFATKDIGSFPVQARSKDTLHIPTQIQRSGQIPIKVQLWTPNLSGRPLGQAVPLNVHSTVLGIIGVIITIVAGGVLALALVLRFVGRWRRRGVPANVADRPWRTPAGASPAPERGPGDDAGDETGDAAVASNTPVAETVPPSETGP